MSDEKNVLKLSGDHIDFNLNLKINLSPLFHAQNAFIPKQTVPETWSHLFRTTFPSDPKYKGKRSYKF